MDAVGCCFRRLTSESRWLPTAPRRLRPISRPPFQVPHRPPPPPATTHPRPLASWPSLTPVFNTDLPLHPLRLWPISLDHGPRCSLVQNTHRISTVQFVRPPQCLSLRPLGQGWLAILNHPPVPHSRIPLRCLFSLDSAVLKCSLGWPHAPL